MIGERNCNWLGHVHVSEFLEGHHWFNTGRVGEVANCPPWARDGYFWSKYECLQRYRLLENLNTLILISEDVLEFDL